jgi:type II secretory pathway pseudopilin PulG
MVRKTQRRDLQTGFTYLGILFAVAIFGATLAMVGHLWQSIQKRENEKELLFRGDQFRQAIGLYYERTPGAAKHYPKSLENLLRDDRYIVPQRYLRRIYIDPMTGKTEWGLVKAPDGGIMGVHSLSDKQPAKSAHFKEADKEFSGSKRYREWVFVYRPVVFMPLAPAGLPKAN